MQHVDVRGIGMQNECYLLLFKHLVLQLRLWPCSQLMGLHTALYRHCVHVVVAFLYMGKQSGTALLPP